MILNEQQQQPQEQPIKQSVETQPDPTVQKPTSTEHNQNESDNEGNNNAQIIDNYAYEDIPDQQKNQTNKESKPPQSDQPTQQQQQPPSSSQEQQPQQNAEKTQEQPQPKKEEENNAQNPPDKTIFSKLAEDMYDKMLRNNDIYGVNNNRRVDHRYFNYEEFINDQYLAAYSQKINGNNYEKIKNFIERNEQYCQQKQYGEQTKLNRLSQVDDVILDKPNDMNLHKEYRKKYSDEEIKKFEEEQKLFLERKKQNIEKLRQRENERVTKELQEKPKVLHTKLHLFKNKTNNEKQQSKSKTPIKVNNNSPNRKTNKKTHKKNAKSFVGVTNNTNTHQQTSPTSPKKMTQEQINTIVTKLHNQAKIIDQKKQLQISNSCKQFKNTSPSPNNSSNKIILNSLLKHIRSQIITLTSIPLEENPSLTRDNYILLFVNLGFYDENDVELSQEIWQFLNILSPSKSNNNSNNNNNKTVTIDVILIFLFCVYDFYTTSFLPILKQNAFWVNYQQFKLTEKEAKSIKKKYHSLYLKRQKQINQSYNNKNKANLYSTQTSQIQSPHNMSHSNSFVSFHTKSKSLNKFTSMIQKEELKLKPSESYNLLLKQKQNKINKQKQLLEQEKTKECTFFPNTYSTTNPNNKTTSIDDISKRLYVSNYEHAKKTIGAIKTPEEIKTQQNCTFAPCLTSYNENIFVNDPIEEDYNVKKQIQRYEKARNDKMNKNNITSTSKANYMRFDNEKKHVKDSFEKFHMGKGGKVNKPNMNLNTIATSTKIHKSKSPYIKTDSNINYNHNNNDVKRKVNKYKEPLLTFEIKIRNKVEILNYYYGEEIEEVADNFVKKNHLSQESKRQIILAIADKLKKY